MAAPSISREVDKLLADHESWNELHRNVTEHDMDAENKANLTQLEELL